jgi:ribokinase
MTEMNEGRVLVAGSINMDIVGTVARHPQPGETLSGSALAYFPGGKGANQAVAASRAGGDVLMIGAVGDDTFGTPLKEFLADNGIDTSHVTTLPETPTGTALIAVDAYGENTIIVVAGANGKLTAVDVAAVSPQPGDVLLAQFETPTPTTTAFFKAGRAVGATCVLNPAPAATIPTELLTLVDVLVVNETELGTVSGETVGDSPSAVEIEAAYERLRALGFAGALVATLGERGAVLTDATGTSEIAGRSVVVRDTTGAGDCFVGNLATSIAGGHDLAEAMTRANGAASLSVQRVGAGPSMPMAEEIDELLVEV